LKNENADQKEQTISDLTKIRQRLLNRVNEYKFVLHMVARLNSDFKNVGSKNFYYYFSFIFALKLFLKKSFLKADEIMSSAQQRYASENIPDDLNEAEILVKQHFHEHDRITKIVKNHLDECDSILMKVRQEVNKISKIR
jgi:hypothetical protein